MYAKGQESGVFVKSLSFAHSSLVLSIFLLNVPSGLTVFITGVLLSGVLEVLLFVAMPKKTKSRITASASAGRLALGASGSRSL